MQNYIRTLTCTIKACNGDITLTNHIKIIKFHGHHLKPERYFTKQDVHIMQRASVSCNVYLLLSRTPKLTDIINCQYAWFNYTSNQI